MTKLVPVSRGKYQARVSDEDYELVSRHTWHAVKPKGKTVYAQTTIRMGNARVNVFMHRVILNVPRGLFTDHIDRDGLNNTRENLRAVTASENNLNRNFPKHNKRTTSKQQTGEATNA